MAEICAAAAARFAGPSDWLHIAAVITLTACPALSLPCGFTGAGRPVGVQLVGRPHGEAALLAAALEAVLKLRPRTPIDPRSPAGAAILSAETLWFNSDILCRWIECRKELNMIKKLA